MQVSNTQLKIIKAQESKFKTDESYWNLLINGIVRPPRAKYK